VFGLSFSELVVIGLVTLVAVGPTRLPGMLRTFGQWMRKLRKMTTDVRQQTGIDDILRAEGLQGGLSELRGLVRGGHSPVAAAPARSANEPYANLEFDVNQEYPPEGADANGALPDDLMVEEESEPAADEAAAAAATPATATPATATPATPTLPAAGIGSAPALSEAESGASKAAPTPADSASDAETARRTT
jgi:sec-independent protein translocase protein TatB